MAIRSIDTPAVAEQAIRYPTSRNGNSIADGDEFEDFCAELLMRYGLFFRTYKSAKYQFNVGESAQGIEIKLDNRCTEMGRLSIEIGEKANASNPEYVSSGIYRNDNTWCYVQGNQEAVYVFSKHWLKRLHNTGNREEHETPTIRAFYLPLALAEKGAMLTLLRGRDF